MDQIKTNEPEVNIEWKFKAPINQLWDAWTNESVISEWFGSDPNGIVVAAKLDPVPGGEFSVSFVDSDRTAHTCYGTYSEVIKPNSLRFDWNWENEPGVRSFVTVNLEEHPGYVLMKFTHSGVGTASQHNYIEGWKGTFKKLEVVLDDINNPGVNIK